MSENGERVPVARLRGEAEPGDADEQYAALKARK